MIQNDVVTECVRLRKTLLQPVNDSFYGPLSRETIKSTHYPMVFLCGNHSSGKSSFCNHVLGRKVQESGVAPTDDCFTIIGPGREDIDRAGPALVDDPDLGFNSLRNFGPLLMHKTQLKIRSNTNVADFMIVDSPGMIDSPVKTNASDEEKSMDRGYDFGGVCRWYGERADVILVFFDPDKPGTTGETLRVLTNSLHGLDHKLHIILNKADQFKQISDYARAYGSLCWNLSKVILRKDLPRIHTMCLPTSVRLEVGGSGGRSTSTSTSNNGGSSRLLSHTASSGAKSKSDSPVRPTATGGSTSKNNSSNSPIRSKYDNSPLHTPPRDPVTPFGRVAHEDEDHFLTEGLESLEAVRRELEAEVFKAPARRVDNEISRLADSVHALTMHCKVLHETVQRYTAVLWRWRYITISASTAAGLLCGTLGFSALQPSTRASISIGPKPSLRLFAYCSVGSVSGLGVLSFLQSRSLARQAAALTSRRSLTDVFQSLYGPAIAKKDKFVCSLWESVAANLELTLTAERLQVMPAVQAKDFYTLERVLEYDTAHLRRRASTSLSPVSSANKLPGGNSSPFRQPVPDSSSLPSSVWQGVDEAAAADGTESGGSRKEGELLETRSPVLLSPPSILSGTASTDSLSGDT